MALTVHKNKTGTVDMTTGALLPKMIRFAIPVLLSSILQLLFHAADVVVVGRFAGSGALASLSPTGSLTNLIINLFVGMSIGASVLVGQDFGSGSEKDVQDTVHTSITFSLVCGIGLAVFGVVFCRPLLTLMDTPADVIDGSVLYMTIYFCGMPIIMLYNFGSSILRAVGDTRRPLYYLTLAGVINVVMNLFFVVVCKMSVGGVALATVVSQGISAVLVLRALMLEPGMVHLDLKKLRINGKKMAKIARIGLPAGIQSSLFSFSNVLIQSSVNRFGAITMAGNTAGSNIESFVNNSLKSMYQANISFTSQNYGAGKYKRLKKITVYSILVVLVMGIILGNLAWYFGDSLLRIYTNEPLVIEVGKLRLSSVTRFEFFCGIMDTVVGGIRGLGYSILPMVVSLAGGCLFRVIWIYTVFAAHPSMRVLYMNYPISWAVTGLVHCLCLLVIWKKRLPAEDVTDTPEENGAPENTKKI